MPSKTIGSPQAIETGSKLPGFQNWLPWIAAGTTGTSSWRATIAAPGIASECPYPGLLPFSTADADRFFGRADIVSDLVARLRERSFVAVVGSSGSGKSSLLRAGLVPTIGDATVITPGHDPVAMLPEVDSGQLLVVDQFEELFSLCDDPDERAAFIDHIFDAQFRIML